MFLASMRFDLGEDVQALQDAVHRFCQDRIRPVKLTGQTNFPTRFGKSLGRWDCSALPFRARMVALRWAI